MIYFTIILIIIITLCIISIILNIIKYIQIKNFNGNGSEIIGEQGDQGKPGNQGNPGIKGKDGPQGGYINTINITSSFDNNQSPYSICSRFIIQENNVSGGIVQSYYTNSPSTNFPESGIITTYCTIPKKTNETEYAYLINSDFYGPVQTLFANGKYYIRYALDNNWSKWSLASGF